MLSAAKHPRKPSYPAPLWAFDEILGLRLSPTLYWDSSLLHPSNGKRGRRRGPRLAQNDINTFDGVHVWDIVLAHAKKLPHPSQKQAKGWGTRHCLARRLEVFFQILPAAVVLML
jgi:hypothetical protein